MLEFSIITIGSFVTMLDSITRYIGKFCFKKDIGRVLPIFSIIYGVALGICGFYTPTVEMGANLIEAIFIGLSAGAAATGINQVGQQLNKKSKEEEVEDETTLVMNALAQLIENIKTNENDSVDEEDYEYDEDEDWDEDDDIEDDEDVDEEYEEEDGDYIGTEEDEAEEEPETLDTGLIDEAPEEEEKEKITDNEPIKYDNDFDD